VAGVGHPVVATSSAAVAARLGLGDHEQVTAEDPFGAVARIATAVSVPVTADLEAGYGLSPADLVDRLLEAGAVGWNLEDSDYHGSALSSMPKRMPITSPQSARGLGRRSEFGRFSSEVPHNRGSRDVQLA
jgi:2-methylisocitrate lyase-like PEP mutase family enzyme